MGSGQETIGDGDRSSVTAAAAAGCGHGFIPMHICSELWEPACGVTKSVLPAAGYQPPARPRGSLRRRSSSSCRARAEAWVAARARLMAWT